MQLVLIKDDCRQLGISCAISSGVSIASRIVVREGPVAAGLASGSALSRCPGPHCPTVLPLGATEWQADRALGATEWCGSQHTRSCQEILCHSAPSSGRHIAHSAPPSGAAEPHRPSARAPRASPGDASGKTATRRPSWREGACGLPADKAPPYRPEKASLAHP